MRLSDGHRHGSGGRFCAPGGGGFGGRAFEGGWGAGRHGGGGRGRRVFDSSELRLMLLKLIADEPRHGYDLIRAIEALTGGAYAPSPGMIYPTLTMLDDMDLIAEQKSQGAKKLFAVTAAGEAHLAERAEEVATLIARLTGMAAQRARTDGKSIRRAMGNLRQALVDRLGDTEHGEDLLHQVVAIIDEAAQKIERLK